MIITDIVPVSITNVSVMSSGVAIADTGVNPGYVWAVEDLSPNEGGLITITGQISSRKGLLDLRPWATRSSSGP